MTTPPPDWMTEAAIARLRAEWAKGTSAQAIARLLGVSKNAIVGKVHRLELPERASPLHSGLAWTPDLVERLRSLRSYGHTWAYIAQCLGGTLLAIHSKARSIGLTDRLALPAGPAVQPAEVPDEAPDEASPDPVRRIAPPPRQAPPAELPRRSRSDCCWPIGEPRAKTFRFCGAPAEPGRPYCLDHCARAYVSVARHRAEQAAEMGGDD